MGVVGDVKQQSLASPNTNAFYVTSAQWSWVDGVQSMVVRTQGDAAALATAVRRAVWSVDRDKPITRVATMEQLIDEGIRRYRQTSSDELKLRYGFQVLRLARYLGRYDDV